MIFNFSTLLAGKLGVIQPPVDKHNPGVTEMHSADIVLNHFENIVSTILGAITIVATLFFIVKFFTGAMNMVTAGEEKSKFDNGREKIKHAILGLILIVISYSLVALLGTVIGVDILNVGTTIKNMNVGGPAPIPIPSGP